VHGVDVNWLLISEPAGQSVSPKTQHPVPIPACGRLRNVLVRPTPLTPTKTLLAKLTPIVPLLLLRLTHGSVALPIAVFSSIKGYANP
jgi:hypothetical protein